MSRILQIDSSLSVASVSVSLNGALLGSNTHAAQMDHAAFMQTGIRDLLLQTNSSASDIAAVAVVSGPGSYTGIRVAMASAKGLAYAWKKPLITVNSLELLAHAAIQEHPVKEPSFWIPQIDARRMEVFTACYDQNGQEAIAPFACILDEQAYLEQLNDRNTYFLGNGAAKWEKICKHLNARFIPTPSTENSFSVLAHQRYQNQQFTDLLWSEPYYVKEFYAATQ
jgi:tRNA threonylcarbamoyladenosine biosynthesis protein TsaB